MTTANITDFEVRDYNDFAHYGAANTDFDVRVTTNTGGSAAHNATSGGCLRLSLTNAATAAVMIGGAVIFQPDEGSPICLEARLRTSDASKSSIFCGLSDANTETNAVIIEDEDGTLNTVPTDAVGFLLEGEQDETWQAVGVKNNADHPQIALTEAADAEDDEFVTLRLEVNKDGDCYFYINGKRVYNQDAMLDATEKYAFVLGADGRETAYDVDLDMYDVRAPRAA